MTDVTALLLGSAIVHVACGRFPCGHDPTLWDSGNGGCGNPRCQPTPTPAPCPRCCHDQAADPTRRPDGDHLVIVQGAPTFDTLPERETNLVRFTASQDVRFVYCSALPDHLRPGREAHA